MSNNNLALSDDTTINAFAQKGIVTVEHTDAMPLLQLSVNIWMDSQDLFQRLDRLPFSELVRKKKNTSTSLPTCIGNASSRGKNTSGVYNKLAEKSERAQQKNVTNVKC